MSCNHRLVRWFIATSLILISPCFLSASTPTKLPYDFTYELFLSDVHCWISRECEGIVRERPDGRFVERLDRHLSTATKSLDLAIYGVRYQDWLLNRIRSLRNKGISVRATIDQTRGRLGDWRIKENFAYRDAFKLYQTLGQANLKPDRNLDGSPRTASIMHNKFYVVDESSVFLGSTNFSETGTGKEYNANSSIIIFSPEIAKLFSQEFAQMFSRGLYSIYKNRHSKPQDFEFRDGTKASVYFAPQDKPIDRAVVPFIESAKKRLSVGIFFLTSSLVQDALIDAHRRGVELRIINDATAARHPSSIIWALRNAGIDVRVENWGGKMHMKTAIADGIHTLIGSMNWSDAGNTTNDESVVVIKNHRQLAAEVEEYLDSLWENLPNSLNSRNYRDPRAESLESINSCFDGINNDHVGGFDTEVPECHP